jgi:hypothetical protein
MPKSPFVVLATGKPYAGPMKAGAITLGGEDGGRGMRVAFRFHHTITPRKFARAMKQLHRDVWLLSIPEAPGL